MRAVSIDTALINLTVIYEKKVCYLRRLTERVALELLFLTVLDFFTLVFLVEEDFSARLLRVLLTLDFFLLSLLSASTSS